MNCMKKLGKFMLGCLGLIFSALAPMVPFVTSILLMSYISAWFAFTFIITFPLSLYLVRVICDLSCTDKFIEWTFGVEIE